MAFQLDFGIWGEIFAVPAIVVDQHIQLCGASSLKVLLVLLRHNRDRLSICDIAKHVGLSEADTQDALNYWIVSGVIKSTKKGNDQKLEPNYSIPEEEISGEVSQNIEEFKNEEPSIALEEKAGQKIIKVSSRPRLSQEEIAQIAKDDNKISTLVQEAQSLLGKPLSPTSTEILVSLYSYGGMTVELILMVIQYCVSMDKGNMRYIEATAYDWIDRGIDTYDKAEQFIMEQSKSNETDKVIKKTCGITGRNLTSKESDYAKKWVDQLRFDEHMITLAYERTVDKTGKFSFPYCDKILSEWNSKGIRTPRQAIDEMNTPYSPPTPYAKADAGLQNNNSGREKSSQAHAELQRRRNHARDVMEQHRAEVYEKIPRIKEIDSDLAKTGFEVSKAVLRGGNTENLLATLRDKNLSLQKEKENILDKYGFPSDYLNPPFVCQVCEDKGYKPDGSMCDCLRALLK